MSEPMRLSLVTMSLVSALVAVGCGDKPADTNPTTTPSGGSSEGTAGASETGTPTTGMVDGTTAGTTGIGSGSSSGVMGTEPPMTTFISDIGDDPTGPECDNWAQDCPRGEKCSAFADNGGTAWNSAKCVMVQVDPGQPGDVCTVEGSAVSGVDSCDKGVMCWDVDPNTQMGVCVALCTGSVEAPMCDSEHTCFVSNDGILNLCLLQCDPLAQDCPGDDLCIPNPQGQGEFACVLDASGDAGKAFDPCEFINSCDKGLFCANPANAMMCDPQAIGCCLPFCDLEEMVMCPGMEQTCLPWFEMGTAPPGLETVGYCGIPA
jgi:hypothetical protein